MNHPKRFYCGFNSGDSKVMLDAKQTHHLKSVLRLKIGSLVEIFNNQGQACFAVVVSLKGKNAGLEITSLAMRSRSQSSVPSVTLACAIPHKSDRMDYLVEKTAEMGLTKLFPLVTERTVVKINSGSSKIERWRKIAVSAAKQTGQNLILDISEPIVFNLLSPAQWRDSLCLIAVPDADNFLSEVLEKAKAEKIFYLIGPEGDFTPGEIKQAVEWGAKPVRLPVNSILRVETAAVAMLAMLFYHYASAKET